MYHKYNIGGVRATPNTTASPPLTTTKTLGQNSARKSRLCAASNAAARRLSKELESEKQVAREDAWAKVSILELEINAAMRDLDFERRREVKRCQGKTYASGNTTDILFHYGGDTSTLC
ncbi:uncharacterized protein [Arachis hypogaea]|uniref:uncharacterized protein n=1 Tax=Arachis hypogaea TaxID=3818 RepID=UPI003B2170A0